MAGIEIFSYNSSNVSSIISLFPEAGLTDLGAQLVVTGERLLERAALVGYFEFGLFLRLPVGSPSEYCNYNPNWNEGDLFPNSEEIDLEIRRDLSGIAEVFTSDENVANQLLKTFYVTEVIR